MARGRSNPAGRTLTQPRGILAEVDTVISSARERIGLTNEALEEVARRQSPGTGCAGLQALKTPEGDLIAALMFCADFATEQELGVGELSRGLTGGHLAPSITRRALGCIARFEDRNGLIVSSRPLGKDRFSWGEPIPGTPSTYAERWDRKLYYARGARDRIRRNTSMAEIQGIADELGIPRPRPRTKRELAALVSSHPGLRQHLETPDVWPADFEYGQTLVLRADEGPTAAMIEQLAAAIDYQTLAITGGRSFLASGLMLYDVRDETPGLISAREERARWIEDKLADLDPVAAELRSRGHRWHFLGRPSKHTDEHGNETVRYWLNGTRVGGHQPAGWYSLDELLAEKFLQRA